jgi:2-polyprenyl-6-methoxyphenol hydroxylase-like FAD-dependent oxidoreductase
MNKQHKTVLIVGAGPTGLTLACELLRRGIGCRIIDKREQASRHSKALGVSATSLLIFERLGFADKIVQQNIKMQDTNFYWNKKRFLHTNYRYLKNCKYPFMLLAHQPVTEKFLTDCLESLGGRIERGISLSQLIQDENFVNVTLVHKNGHVELGNYEEVIGCDGSQSTVREMLGVKFCGENYGLHFIYGDFELDGWHGDPTIAHYYMEGSNLLIILPSPNAIYRIVGLVLGDKDKRPVSSQQELQAYLDKYGPGGITLKNPTQLGSVPIYYRVTEQIRVRRVFLAGDAFHLFSPIGGQGMNSGIQDAYNLAWKLAYVKKGVAAENLLDTYELERLPLVRQIVNNVKNSVELIIRQDKENDLLVSTIKPVFSNRNNFRNNFPKSYSGFNYSYPENDFIQEHLAVTAKMGFPKAGQYTDDFDALHSSSDFTLLISTSNNELSAHHKCELERLMLSYSFIKIKYKQDTTADRFCLIRPDGYIAYQAKLEDYSIFLEYLSKFYKKDADYAK